MSLYWMFRLGFRSILAWLWASWAKCWMNISYKQLVSAHARVVEGGCEANGCDGYHEGGVVGACVDVLVHVYNLLHPSYCDYG